MNVTLLRVEHQFDRTGPYMDERWLDLPAPDHMADVEEPHPIPEWDPQPLVVPGGDWFFAFESWSSFFDWFGHPLTLDTLADSGYHVVELLIGDNHVRRGMRQTIFDGKQVQRTTPLDWAAVRERMDTMRKERGDYWLQ